MSGYRARMRVSRSTTKRGGGGAGCSASASDIAASVKRSARGGPFQARDRLAGARERYVEVGDEADAVLPTLRVAEQAFGLARGGEGYGAHREIDVDEQEIRLGHRAAQSPDALHSFGDRLGAAVVLVEPLQVVVERVDAGRGEDAHLAHSASQALAEPLQQRQAGAGSRHQRSSGGAQSLAQRDAHGVRAGGVLGELHPGSDVSIPEPGSV